MRQISLSIILVLLVAACAVQTPRARLAQAEIAYANLVETAISLRSQGRIEPGSDRERRVTEALEAANAALSVASTHMTQGEAAAAARAINAALSSIYRASTELESTNE